MSKDLRRLPADVAVLQHRVEKLEKRVDNWGRRIWDVVKSLLGPIAGFLIALLL